MSKLEAALRFHRDNQIPLAHNIFRPHSENYYKLFEYARQMKESALAPLNEFDEYLLSTDIGKFGMYEGKEVPLDHPFIDEADYKGDDVELNKPKRGGKKKFYVYVKNEKGNVIKVQFGDDTGLSAKINDPEARKSFSARHNCPSKKDKTTPGYWSCNLPRYASQLGLKGGGSFYW
jgi:hypothetical protein